TLLLEKNPTEVGNRILLDTLSAGGTLCTLNRNAIRLNSTAVRGNRNVVANEQQRCPLGQQCFWEMIGQQMGPNRGLEHREEARKSDRLWIVGPCGGAGAVPVLAARHRGPSGRRTSGEALH
ncbi:hypothetical protein ACLOJK_024085, partial [Asimina triloba]